MAIEKMKMLGAFLELPAEQDCGFGQFDQIWPNFEVNGLDWLCCLAGSSKTAPRIFIFSIVLGAEYLFYVKSIETYTRALLTLNILSIGTVFFLLQNWICLKKISLFDSRSNVKDG